MGARVAVAGASGYAGGELLRLLASHPDLEVGPLAAYGSAGAAVTSVHPHLNTLSGRNFVPTDREHLADADLLFTALPHGESAELARNLPGSLKIVDLSADFRLADPAAWQQFYKTEHAGTWTYGLPELPGARDAIKTATRVAAPGCYATAAILALRPLIDQGLIDETGIVIVAASGTSGAGRSLKPHLLATDVMGSMSAYEVGGTHRHTPEIEQALGPMARVSFTPTLAPMSRGILATSSAPLKTRTTTSQALRDAYQPEPFVHLLEEGTWPATASTLGSNAAQLQVTADPHAGRAVVVTALDNLGKGAAGQAVQIANLMLGLPEQAGLTQNGVAP